MRLRSAKELASPEEQNTHQGSEGDIPARHLYGEFVLQTLAAAGALVNQESYSDNHVVLDVNVGKLDSAFLKPRTGIALDHNGTTSSDMGIAISNSVGTVFKEGGFHLIMPGERRRFGKWTLSLMLQSDCKAVITSGSSTYIRSTYMKPIYTGPKAGSNHNYHIKDWGRKKGIKTEIIEGVQSTSAAK